MLVRHKGNLEASHSGVVYTENDFQIGVITDVQEGVMTLIGIILIFIGLVGFGSGTIAFGDIGIACMIAGAAAFFSGIGFIISAGKIKKLK